MESKYATKISNGKIEIISVFFCVRDNTEPCICDVCGCTRARSHRDNAFLVFSFGFCVEQSASVAVFFTSIFAYIFAMYRNDE